MELITAKDTIDFLSKSAPRAWVKRMLLWMIFMNEITAYFREASSIAKTRVSKVLLDALGSDFTAKNREELIRSEFEAEFAAQLIAAGDQGEVEELAHQWGRDDSPEPVSIGYFLHATNTDWENGVVQATGAVANVVGIWVTRSPAA